MNYLQNENQVKHSLSQTKITLPVKTDSKSESDVDEDFMQDVVKNCSYWTNYSRSQYDLLFVVSCRELFGTRLELTPLDRWMLIGKTTVHSALPFSCAWNTQTLRHQCSCLL